MTRKEKLMTISVFIEAMKANVAPYEKDRDITIEALDLVAELVNRELEAIDE